MKSSDLDPIVQQSYTVTTVTVYIYIPTGIHQDAPQQPHISVKSLAYFRCSIESLQHMQGALELVVTCKVALVHNQNLGFDRNGKGMEWVKHHE